VHVRISELIPVSVTKGNVYRRIIDEVVLQCRDSFEAEGAQPGVLEELQKVGGLFSLSYDVSIFRSS